MLGHVFVVRGDANRISCDFRVIPAGTSAQAAGSFGDVRSHWLVDERIRRAVEAADWADRAPREEERAVLIAEPSENDCGLIVVHTGASGTESPSWYAKAFDAAAELALNLRALPRNKRALPLIVMPLLGTGAGGGGEKSASVMEELFAAAYRCVRRGVDVALVLSSASAFAAAQRYRASADGQERWNVILSDERRRVAATLARRARAGQLVPFIGAGASMAAGLMGWTEALLELGVRAGMGGETELLKDLDARDAGDILSRRLAERGTSLDHELRQLFATEAPSSLAHALLASLPVREAATTNYDGLFETAWRAALSAGAGGVTVLPGDLGESPGCWLLKLHGDGVDADGRELVLSREQYFDLEHEGAAITAVLQAVLLTRHLLVVGYGLSDETFHRIVHDVRKARRAPGRRALLGAAGQRRVGTGLLVEPSPLLSDVWSEDLELVDFSAGGASIAAAARDQDVFLDYLAFRAAPVESYILGAGWEELSNDGPDRDLREALKHLGAIENLAPALKEAVDDVLHRFGSVRTQQRGTTLER